MKDMIEILLLANVLEVAFLMIEIAIVSFPVIIGEKTIIIHRFNRWIIIKS